jgi:hypothetical protein
MVNDEMWCKHGERLGRGVEADRAERTVNRP